MKMAGEIIHLRKKDSVVKTFLFLLYLYYIFITALLQEESDEKILLILFSYFIALLFS